MVNCCVNGCSNRSEKRKQTFHRFPADREVKNQWIKNLGFLNWNPTRHDRVCSEHFEAECFRPINSGKRTRLIYDAVPTIFNNLQGAKRIRRKIKLLSEPSASPEVKFETLLTSRKRTIQDIEQSSFNSITTNNKTKTSIDEPQLDDSIDNIHSNISSSQNAFFFEISAAQNNAFLGRSEAHNMLLKLEKKCDKLRRENIALKINDEYMKRLNNALILKIGEFEKVRKFKQIPSAANSLIDLTIASSMCRFCLQKSKEFKLLSEQIYFANPEIPSAHISNILKSLGIDSFIIHPNLPDKICSSCLDCIKCCYTFKRTYRKTEHILKFYLENILNNVPGEHSFTSGDNSNCKSLLESFSENSSGCDEENKIIEIVKKEHEEENLFNTEQLDFEIGIESNSSEGQLSKLKENNSCEKANFKTKRNADRNGHLNSELETTVEDQPFFCPICMKELSIDEYRQHILTHNNLKKFIIKTNFTKEIRFFSIPHDTITLLQKSSKIHCCPFCNENLDAVEFLAHMESHLLKDHYTCQKCDRVFKKRSYLSQHMLLAHEKLPFKCEICKKSFSLKNNYEYHVLTHSVSADEYPYNCELCERKFTNPENLNRHVTIHIEKQSYSKKYYRKKCLQCLQTFQDQEKLNNHRCHKLPIQICNHCKKAFATVRALNDHISIKHGIGMSRKGFCIKCNKNVLNIIKHKTEVHSQLIVCPVCGKCVKDITTHQQQHSEERPFKCLTCSKGFKFRGNLIKHSLIHTGLKSFLCSYCGKNFTTRDSLYIHERIHTGNKRHVCRICNKGFLEKSYLTKHMNVHVGLDQTEDHLGLFIKDNHVNDNYTNDDDSNKDDNCFLEHFKYINIDDVQEDNLKNDDELPQKFFLYSNDNNESADNLNTQGKELKTVDQEKYIANIHKENDSPNGQGHSWKN